MNLRRIVLFFAANILFATGLGFHAFLYNFYLEGLKLSPAVMGRAAATWSLGGLIVLLPVGRSVDKWGPRAVLVAAALCAGVGLAWGAVARNPAAIYFASALAGASGVSWRVAQAPVLMDLTSKANRSRFFTLDVAILVATGAAATALSGHLVSGTEAGWHLSHDAALTAVMLIGAAITALSALIYFTLDLTAERSAERPEQRPLVISRRVVLLVLLSGAWIAALTLASPFFNLYFARQFQLPLQRVSLIFSAATIATAILLTGAGEVATRFGARLAFVVWLSLFAPAMWGLAVAPSVGIAAACYLAQSIVSPAANPLLDQLLFESVPAERRGVVSSLRQAMASAGQVVAQSAGGSILAASSFATLFGLAGGIGLAAGGAVAFVAWRLVRE